MMPARGFQGMRVLALENRRAAEIAKLIRTFGGEPTIVSALREVPTDSNQEALEFAARLIHGDFDLVIFLTGVGVRRLVEVISSQYDRDAFFGALRRVKVASRGPKPSSALRELQVPIAVVAPEPCTWREMVTALDGAYGTSLAGMRAAVQEYGETNPDLLAALGERHVECARVPVYHWALPEDLEPLKKTVRAIAGGEFDVIIFLTGSQIAHLFQVAEQIGEVDAMRRAMRRTVLFSIGPSTSEELESHGLHPDFVPTHPRMGVLVNEGAECAGKLLEEKRGQST